MVRGSSAAEPIVDGVNGLLCQDETLDLARVMESAITDPERIRTIGQEARRTVPKNWDGIIDSVLQEYKKIISEY